MNLLSLEDIFVDPDERTVPGASYESLLEAKVQYMETSRPYEEALQAMSFVQKLQDKAARVGFEGLDNLISLEKANPPAAQQQTIFQKAWTALKRFFGAIGNFFKRLFDKIKSVFQGSKYKSALKELSEQKKVNWNLKSEINSIQAENESIIKTQKQLADVIKGGKEITNDDMDKMEAAARSAAKKSEVRKNDKANIKAVELEGKEAAKRADAWAKLFSGQHAKAKEIIQWNKNLISIVDRELKTLEGKDDKDSKKKIAGLNKMRTALSKVASRQQTNGMKVANEVSKLQKYVASLTKSMTGSETDDFKDFVKFAGKDVKVERMTDANRSSGVGYQ